MSNVSAGQGIPLPSGYVRADDGSVRAAQLVDLPAFNEQLQTARDLMGSAHLHLARTVGMKADRQAALEQTARGLQLEALPESVLKIKADPAAIAFRKAYTDFHRAVGLLLFPAEARIDVPGMADNMLSPRAWLAEALEWMPAIEQAFRGQAELWAASTGEPVEKFLEYARPGIRYVSDGADGGHLRVGGKRVNDIGELARLGVQRLRTNIEAAGAPGAGFQAAKGRTLFNVDQRNQMLQTLNRGMELVNDVMSGGRAPRFARMIR